MWWNREHRAILGRGVQTWNDWRVANPDVRPDLRGAPIGGIMVVGAHECGEEYDEHKLAGINLRRADLSRAELGMADLREADLRESNLSRAELIGATLCEATIENATLTSTDLRRADLRGADLRNANLGGAMLAESDLTGADLRGANLYQAVFSETKVRGTSFRGCDFGKTTFVRMRLDLTAGLDTCRHLGPSAIDHTTLEQSLDLPVSFLRGCGLSEAFIKSLPSLKQYSCFICYSSRDEEFANRLHTDLQGSGVRCWFAVHDIRGGQKIHEQIDQAIQVHDRLLLVLSESSMNSEWVETEIAKARQREVAEGQQVLFPISLVSFDEVRNWKCFDADTGKDSAREIREYYIPDFSNWMNHDAYQKAFERLLRDLKK